MSHNFTASTAQTSSAGGSYWDFAGGNYDFIGEELKAANAIDEEDLGFDW